MMSLLPPEQQIRYEELIQEKMNSVPSQQNLRALREISVNSLRSDPALTQKEAKAVESRIQSILERKVRENEEINVHNIIKECIAPKPKRTMASAAPKQRRGKKTRPRKKGPTS